MQNPVTDIAEADERDGIRFTFNTWPGTRMEATKCVVPMGCLYAFDNILVIYRYTPLKTIYGMPSALPYQPVRCRQPNCGAILNPYWYVILYSSEV